MVASQSPNMTDYEAERRNFQLDVPEYFNFAADVIDKQAQHPVKEAMLWIGQHGEERHITFAHFSDASSRAANAFSALGLGKGDPVLVMLPRVPEWWEAILGLMRLGAIPIPCTTLLTPKDIRFRSEVAEARAFITDQEGAGKFDQVRKECPTITQTITRLRRKPPHSSQARRRAAMILAWSISPPARLAILKWCCIPTPAILSAIPSLANTGLICMKMTSSGTFQRPDGQNSPIATCLAPGSWARLCLSKMRVVSSAPSKHWKCSTSTPLPRFARHLPP